MKKIAETGEPPVDDPDDAVVAVDVHEALIVAPPVERGIAPVAARVLPVGTVRILVGESRVGFIDRRE